MVRHDNCGAIGGQLAFKHVWRSNVMAAWLLNVRSALGKHFFLALAEDKNSRFLIKKKAENCRLIVEVRVIVRTVRNSQRHEGSKH